MKPAEIICTTVLPEDIEKSHAFALQALPAKHAPARSSPKPVKHVLDHLHRLLIGKCTELATERFFKSHGIAHQRFPGLELSARSARFFFRVSRENIELKFVALSDSHATASKIVRLDALVPLLQWRKHNRIGRYLFAYYHGDLRLVVNQNVSSLATAWRLPAREQVALKGGEARIFLTAYASRRECAKRFQMMVAPHDSAMQHIEPAASYIGCPVAELTSFKKAVHWGGV